MLIKLKISVSSYDVGAAVVQSALTSYDVSRRVTRADII